VSLVSTVLLAACAGSDSRSQPPGQRAVSDPCNHMGALVRDSRFRLESLYSHKAIAESQWSCMAQALTATDKKFSGICKSAAVEFGEVSDDLRGLYAACVLAPVPEVVECAILTRDQDCLKSVAAKLSPPARTDLTLSGVPPEAIVADLPFLESGELNRVFVNLAPDGERPFRLILDTGASDSVLTPRYARDLGVTVRRARDRPNERSTVLGRPLQFWIDTESSESASRTGWEYGLLGGTFLGEYVIDLDFVNRRVRFIDADKWQTPKSVDAQNEAVLPLRVVGNRPFVHVEVEGKSVDVLLDTGAPMTMLLSGEGAKRAGFSKHPLAQLAGGGVLGPIETYLVEADKLVLGPFSFEPAPIAFAPQGAYNQGGSTDSLIGYELLSHFHVRIDYRHKRLWLRREGDEPLAWFGSPWVAVRRVGLLATSGEGGIEVYGVLPDSPASKLGVRAGDSIEFHNDMPAAKALEAVLGTIERGERLTVVRYQNEVPSQVELGDEKPVTPAN